MAKLGPRAFQDPDTGDMKLKREVQFTPAAHDVKSTAVAAAAAADEQVEEDVITSASSYSASIRKRKAAVESAKSNKRPLGGAPPLDPAKMNQLAGHLGQGKGMAAPSFPPVPGSAEAGDLPRPPPPPQLPPEQLPKGARGVGSSLAYNQAMARGEVDKPLTLAEAKRMEERQSSQQPPMSFSPTPQAQRILNAMASAPTQEQETANQPPKPPGPGSEEERAARMSEVDEELIESSIKDLLAPRMAELDEVRRILLNPERRKLIESRLSPMDISDLIFNREIQQEIPIVSGRFSLTLKTMRQYENMFCLQQMYGVASSDMYVSELLTTYKLTCCLVAINGSPLPDHRVETGQAGEKVDEKRFKHKFNILLGQATPILAEVGVQYDWFIVRVNQLLSLESLKNG